MKYLSLINEGNDMRVLSETTDKYNCLFYIENYIQEFLIEKQGNIDQNNIVFNEPSHDHSLSWRKLPFGYIVTRNKYNINAFTIYFKSHINGILFDSYDIKKIFVIQMAVHDKQYLFDMFNFTVVNDQDIKENEILGVKYNLCLCFSELLDRFEKKEE